MKDLNVKEGWTTFENIKVVQLITIQKASVEVMYGEQHCAACRVSSSQLCLSQTSWGAGLRSTHAAILGPHALFALSNGAY